MTMKLNPQTLLIVTLTFSLIGANALWGETSPPISQGSDHEGFRAFVRSYRSFVGVSRWLTRTERAAHFFPVWLRFCQPIYGRR